MKAETLVRRLAILVVGGLITLAAACADEPVAPTSDEAAAPRQLAGAAGAEEEIFGLVYNNKVRITAASLTVTLQEVAGTGACIHHFTTGTPTCLGSQTMRVNPTGIRPGQTTIMWGWYNNLDTDTNPCRSGELDHSERHDENPRDGIPDSGDEKHCIKPGVYKVTLTSGSTTITRTVDHRLVKGTMGNGKAIEDPTVTHPGASNFKDTIVHLDVAAGASYALQQLDSIDIDNPQSTPTQEFAPGDTAVATNVPIRVNSRATTPQWDSNASIGRLLARVYWDRAQNPTVRTEHWNPDQVVRTHPYTQSRTFEVRVEATTPNRTTDTGTISSRARKVVVTAPVASVTVSPPFATITTQNGTKTLTATLRDAAGNILTGRPISWSSSNTTVATVSGSGGTATVTGKANGTATITASSEGKNDTSAITVSFSTGTDNAAANGHTLPQQFFNGNVVSVTVTMKNTGTATWTGSAGYALDLWRDQAFWAMTPIFGSGSVAHQASRTFAFDLRMDDPERRGTTACFFRMKHSGIFFGTENGRNIEVTGPKGGTQALAETGVSAATLGFDPKLEWLDGARGSGTTQIPLDATAFRSAESVVFEYAYAHETPRSIDIVFKYVFDPAVFEPLSVEPGVAGLVVMAGLGAPGEFWVRFVGNVPEGSGRIAGLPFRLLPSAKAPTQSSATLTIYYPQE